MEKEGLDSVDALKREIQALKQNRDAINLQEGLKRSIDRLIEIFETGIQYIQHGSDISEVSNGLKRLLDENAVIAKGIIKLTNAIEGLDQKLTEITLSLKGAPEMSEIASPPTTLFPKHQSRKRAFDRYKEEFSK